MFQQRGDVVFSNMAVDTILKRHFDVTDIQNSNQLFKMTVNHHFLSIYNCQKLLCLFSRHFDFQYNLS